MKKVILVGVILSLGGCSVHSVSRSAPDSGAIVVSDRASDGRDREHGRSVHVPPGHYPPPGKCRIWYVGVPPGHQPKPAECGALIRRVPRGAFLLYNKKAWDTEYDWHSYERRHAGSVPGVVLRIMASVAR